MNFPIKSKIKKGFLSKADKIPKWAASDKGKFQKKPGKITKIGYENLRNENETAIDLHASTR